MGLSGPPTLQIVFFFSIHSLLPFSILSLLPFLISPSLSTIPSCSSDQFLDKHFMFHSVSLLSQAPLARGSRALPSILLLVIITIIIIVYYAEYGNRIGPHDISTPILVVSSNAHSNHIVTGSKLQPITSLIL